MLAADRYLPPPAELAEYVFDYYLWNNPQTPLVSLSTEPLPPLEQAGILFLTHADTDLLGLHHAMEDLPDGFPAPSKQSASAALKAKNTWPRSSPAKPAALASSSSAS